LLNGKKYTWHKIADSVNELHFADSGLAQVVAGGKTVCIARHRDSFSACTQKCPHAGGLMADGHLDALGNIVCPLHRYKFSLQNGRNITGEGYFLKTFPLEIRKEGVFIGFEQNNSLNWLK